MVPIDTLHPDPRRAATFRWEREKAETTVTEYGTNHGRGWRPSAGAPTRSSACWRTRHLAGGGGGSAPRGRSSSRCFPKYREGVDPTDLRAAVHQPLLRRRRDRRDGLFLHQLDDRPSRRVFHCGCCSARSFDALSWPCDQVCVPCPHRQYAGRDLSWARRRTAGAARPHRPRRCRPYQDSAVV